MEARRRSAAAAGARGFVALGLALLAVMIVHVGAAGAAEMPETERALVNQESTPLCAPECEAITAPSRPPDGDEYEGDGPGGGFTPQELREAYGVPDQGGEGVTVAIVDDVGDPEAEYDLGRYREEFGLPPCTKANGCFRQVNEEGRETRPSFGSWYGEISLDMDMVSVGCPKCNVLLVEGEGREGRMEAIKTAVEMGAAVVTNSWNFGFEAGNPANSAACLRELCVSAGEERRADEQLESAAGIPILFSGGDYGYAVRFPASSPDVVSVGGTALSRDPQSPRGWSEETWSNLSYGVDQKGRGGGGGCAVNEPKPTWETDSACPGRIDNDVAAVADPRTPVSVYSAYSGWRLVGGTSASTPFVAGVEGLSSAGSRVAGAAAFWSAAAADSLFDVTEGQIGECTGPAEASYWCTAGVGFDAPTGWGTPDGPLELPSAPLATTGFAGATTPTTAVLNGRVDDEGVAGGTDCSFQVTTANDASFATPVVEVPCEPDPIEGAGEVAVSATVNGLSPHTAYIFRAVATNADGGPIYGDARSLTTTPEPPRASLEPAVHITRHEAELRATVDNEGAPDGTSCAFEVTTDDDVKFLSPFETIPCEPGTVSGEGAGEVGATLTGLEQNSIYYYRVVVSSSGGTPPPSDPLGLRTLPRPPDATTGGVTEITSTGARLIGLDEDEADWEGSSCAFEVAAIGDAAFASPVVTVPCVSGALTGEDGFGVNALVSGLAPETGYRYRVEAANRGGTTFGDSETFETARAPASPPAEIGRGPGGGVLVLGPPDEIEMRNPQATSATVGGPGAATKAPPPPSNSIKVGAVRVHGESVLLTVTVPGPGTVSVGGGAVRPVTDRSVAAGPVTVRVALTKATLRRASRRRVEMKLRVTFTPTGGTAATKSVTVVVGRSPSGR